MERSYTRQVQGLCFLTIACVISVAVITSVIQRRNQLIAEKLSKTSPSCTAFLLIEEKVSLESKVVMSSGTDWEKSKTEDDGYRREPYSHSDCKCVRKCCLKGYVYDKNWKCIKSGSKLFEQYSSIMCPIRYNNTPESAVVDNILENYKCTGSVSQWYKISESFTSDSMLSQIDESLVCLELVKRENAIYIMKCSDLPLWFFIIRACGHVISALFTVMSILLYSIQPALRNLPGKVLMCHMICLLVTQISIPLHETDIFTNYPTVCKVVAYFVQISSLTSAFWLNVLCFDIWWVFSGITQRHLQSKAREWKMFTVYSCYAWGGPLILTFIATLMDLLPDVSPYCIKPKFGYLDCWFNDKDARVLYYELPIGVLLCLNLLMFVTTACRLKSSKVGESHRNRERKQRFMIILKMFLVMGVYWLVDIMNPILGTHRHLWMVPNIMMTLQGLLIFIVVICNRRTSQYIRQRFSTIQSSSV